jgi:hypothetical protein
MGPANGSYPMIALRNQSVRNRPNFGHFAKDGSNGSNWAVSGQSAFERETSQSGRSANDPIPDTGD